MGQFHFGSIIFLEFPRTNRLSVSSITVMNEPATSPISISPQRRLAAWSVHAFTASGVLFGLFAMNAIFEEHYILAFWFMSGAILVDALDGVLARAAMTKVAAPQIDGALLDNMVDYLNYVVVPAVFVMQTSLLSPNWRLFTAGVIGLASAYQFSHRDAKTKDHFFRGFPSYWNIVVFYLFFLQLSPIVNLIILLGLAILVFVPIKYVYPSRLDYLANNRWGRYAMILATLLWGVATALLIINYPESHPLLTVISLGYGVVYVLVSLYRTLVPLQPDR